MATVTEKRCDRCGRRLEPKPEVRYGVLMELHHHHHVKLDICKDCEGEFTLWLGKNPTFPHATLEQILNQTATGDGYPTAEQIARYKLQRDADRPWPYWTYVDMPIAAVPGWIAKDMEDKEPGTADYDTKTRTLWMKIDESAIRCINLHSVAPRGHREVTVVSPELPPIPATRR